jgi:hypothetical protein
MPQDPREVPLNTTATSSLSVAAGYSDTDLAEQDGKPAHAAQIVDFHNAGTTTESATWTDINGTNHSRPIAAGGDYSTVHPVAVLLATSGNNISAEVHWWKALGAEFFEAP